MSDTPNLEYNNILQVQTDGKHLLLNQLVQKLLVCVLCFSKYSKLVALFPKKPFVPAQSTKMTKFNKTTFGLYFGADLFPTNHIN